MTTLNALLDKAKENRSIPSDMALAEALHVSRSAISLWRKGGVIAEKHLTALVSLADADPATAVQVLAEQATTRAERSVWGSVLQRLAQAAMISCVAVLATPAPAKAETLTGTGTMHYAKLCTESVSLSL